MIRKNEKYFQIRRLRKIDNEMQHKATNWTLV